MGAIGTGNMSNNFVDGVEYLDRLGQTCTDLHSCAQTCFIRHA